MYEPLPLLDSLSIDRLYTLYLLDFEEGYQFQGEQHDFWEMDYILNGTGGITSGDQLFECSQGDLVLHSPNLFHSFWTTGQSSCRTLTLSFHGKGLLFPAGSYHLNEQEKSIIDLLLKEIPSLFTGYNTSENERLKNTVPLSNVGYQMVKNCIELLCLSLSRRSHTAATKPSNHPKSQLFSKAVTFLKENVCQAVTLEDLCRELAESPSSVKQLFRKFAGCSVMKYYRTLRVQESVRLLAEGYSVCEVADRLNFSSQNYFSNFFKRETGCSPSKYTGLSADGINKK